MEMDFITDIHSHILPGVDDGFRSGEKSRQALCILYEAGLRQAILTPHIYPELYPDNSPEKIRKVFSGFESEAASSGVSCRIAGEHMVYAGMESGFNAGDDSILALPGRHILIEMSYAYESPNIREFIFHLNAIGLSPVLAHPERYGFYGLESEEIEVFKGMDTSLQLNILSLGGFYGPEAKDKAEYMLEHGMYDYLGTDLHSLSQIEQLNAVRIRKKHVPAIERLLDNNNRLWNS